ncbi:MAG TPA: ribonuclease HII [bacterium]|nr:ribonuclease HII [bacterium]
MAGWRERYACLAAFDAGQAQPLAGIDEAGRGPLAGPVVCAAVVLPPDGDPFVAGDSKQLSARARAAALVEIKARALAWSVAVVGREEIDRDNILVATLAGMRRAWLQLAVSPALTLIDGNQLPAGVAPAQTLVRGDGTSLAVACASVLAKETRDALMIELDARYPEYGFAQHKGYGTAAHLAALRARGPCPEHRRTFAPVSGMLAGTHA